MGLEPVELADVGLELHELDLQPEPELGLELEDEVGVGLAAEPLPELNATGFLPAASEEGAVRRLLGRQEVPSGLSAPDFESMSEAWVVMAVGAAAVVVSRCAAGLRASLAYRVR